MFRGSRSSTTARLVVPTNQIGFLLEQGVFVSTRPFVVLILDVAHNPKCVSANDQVVQVLSSYMLLIISSAFLLLN